MQGCALATKSATRKQVARRPIDALNGAAMPSQRGDILYLKAEQ
jgi:hypothetical protein